MNNKFRLLSLVLSGTFIVACGNQAGGSSSGATSLKPEVSKVEPQVALDQISVVPVATGANLSYRMRINNFTNSIYGLVSVKVTDMEGKKDKSDVLRVTASVGVNIPANTSMALNLEPKTDKSDDVLLTVQVKKVGGEVKTLRQIIRLSDSVKSSAGIASYNDLSTIITADNNYGMAIPFVLNKNFTSVKSINGQVSCPGNQFIKGSPCTLLVKGKLTGDSRYVSTDIVGYTGTQEDTRSSGGSMVRFGNEGNLLVSHGLKIQSANGVSVANMVLFNNGTSSLTVNSVEPTANPSQLTLNRTGCLGALAPSGQCTIPVSANSDISKFEGVLAQYNTPNVNNSARAVSTTILYHGTSQGDTLNLTPTVSGTLTGTLQNNTNQVDITLTNNGANINNLSVNLPHEQSNNSKFSVANNTCPSSLANGNSCSFSVQYTPTTVEQGSLNMNIIASLANKPDSLLHIPIDYSSISIANALAIEVEPGFGTDFLVLAGTPGSSRTNSFVIKNQSLQLAATLEPSAQWAFNPLLTLTPPPLISIPTQDGCTTSLNANSQCRFEVTYSGAGLSAHPIQRANLGVPYTIGASPSVNVLSPELSFEATDGPLIDVTPQDIQVFSSNGTAGPNNMVLPVASPFIFNNAATGFSDAPYTFIMPNVNSYFAITYKFRNISGQDAINFNVANLPYLGEVITKNLTDVAGTTTLIPATDCPVGTKVRNLIASEECNISLRLPLSDIIHGNISANTTNEFLAARFEIAPELSYSNATATGVRVHSSDRFHRYFDYTRSWANINVTPDTANAIFSPNTAAPSAGVWRITYTVQVNPGTTPWAASNSNTRVTLKQVPGSNVDITNLLPTGASATCTTNPCTFSLELSTAHFTPGATVPVIFEVTNSNATPIEIKRSFGLPNWSSN